MSHLVEVYAKDLGVKIGEPHFKPHFFPLLEENYITITMIIKFNLKNTIIGRRLYL